MLRRAVAVIAGFLFASLSAHAQTMQYGPLLARGIDPDTMYLKWGFTTSTPATLNYRKAGAATWQTLSSPDGVDHELKLYGLALDGAYEYSVAYGATQTPNKTFTTCPSPGMPLDIVVLGDSRDGGTRAKTIMDLVKAEAPDLILETGDIASNGAFDEYLTQFIAIASDVVDTIPFMASPGNHDWLSTPVSNYGRIFAVPRDADEAWRSYYYFTCGNVRFLSLDSSVLGSLAQLDFATNQLAAASADPSVEHVIVYFHHSPYSPGSHGDNTSVQNKWVPLFELADSKVRFVFTGHDHIYSRLSNGSAVTYVVTGGAGAPKYPIDSVTVATQEVSLSTYNYVKLHVVGSTIAATAIDSNGATIDTFSAVVPPSPDLAVPTPPDLAASDLGAPDLSVSADDLATTPPTPTQKAGGCTVSSVDRIEWLSLALVLLAFAIASRVSSRSAVRSVASRRR